jgi:multiple sugar transport system ATP-binding protein
MVTRIEHLGDQSHLHLDLAGQGLVTLADPDSELQAGDRVGVILKSALLFDADGERMGA